MVLRLFCDQFFVNVNKCIIRGAMTQSLNKSVDDTFQYAAPLLVTDLAACSFYHRMEIPGMGEVGAQWDLRDCIHEYLGRYDFANKRVLDVGAASGFLTFSMEKMGANVVSFDMESGDQWDIVPQKSVRQAPEKTLDALRQSHHRLKNAYWFTHASLGSRAKAYYGDIYNLPSELGHFDVAVFGMIISHLRDPFKAIYSASQLCRKHLIITNQVVSQSRRLIDFFLARKYNPNTAYFLPTAENGETMAWWSFSEGCLENMLAVIGFRVVRKVISNPKCLVSGRLGREKCIALVAERFED